MVGIDDAIIAALVTAALSAGTTAYTTNEASKKQQRETMLAQQRQMGAQNEATRLAASKAAEFDPEARKQQQDAIGQALTGELEQQVSAPLVTAQGVQVGTTIEGGTGDYLTSKAKEQAKTTASLRELAALMGRIGSAGELRRNEAVGLGDTAGAIGRIQGGANNIWQADQPGITAAGEPGIGGQLAGEALRMYGAYAASKPKQKPLHGSAGGNPQFPEYGMSSGDTGGWV